MRLRGKAEHGSARTETGHGERQQDQRGGHEARNSLKVYLHGSMVNTETESRFDNGPRPNLENDNTGATS